ncbi:hypothetical protein L7F22_031915 [Adiantum nelumboides]|nr:hypothetical protein [Adiantum nelumboides]
MLNEAPKEKEKIQEDYWWEQVIVLSKYDSKKGGTKRFQCRYCGIQRGGSAMRVNAHLFGIKGHDIKPCGKIRALERARMEREYVLFPEIRGSNNLATISASRPPSSSSAATLKGEETFSHSSWPQPCGSTRGKQSSLFTSWHPQQKAQVDAAVARFFYSCGISFNVARSPFFKEMVSEIAQFGPTYQPPSFDVLREKLLDEEVASIKEAILPVRQKWEAYGVSLVGDGWSNIRSTSLEGVLASCRGMPLYIESTECGARQKTAPVLCEMWSKAVEYVGPKNVVQFVSDGEASNRVVGGLLEQKYPHITWSPCMAHCLNNLLKDIGGLPWAKATFATGHVRDAGDEDNEKEGSEEQYEAQDCEDNDEEATPDIVVDHDMEP